MNSTNKAEALHEFIHAFEEVFDRDWNYTKTMLGIDEETEAHKEAAQQAGLEPIYTIAPDGTFLHPNVEDEVEDWGNRA